MATKKTPSKKSATKAAAPVLLTDFFQPDFWSQHRAPVLAYMAISFIFYGITIGFGYLQDDQLFIWDNSFVQQGFGGLANIFGHDSLLGFYKDPKLMLEGGRYRPLPLATFAMEIGLVGKDSAGVAHFFNVLYYGLTGILLYRILLGLFPVKTDGKWFLSIPFLAVLIFMVHPLHVEAVANIKSRDEIFALLGSLGALWGTMKYLDTQQNKWRWVAALCFFLGMLSKENTATFLAVIPLTLWMFSNVSFGRIMSACGPMLLALLAFLILRANALDAPIDHPDELVLNPFFGMKAPEKLATIFFSLGWYLKLLFVPHPLTIDYYPYHVPKVTWADWRVLVSLAGYVAMGFWALRKMSKIRNAGEQGWAVPAYSILYFFLTISVVSNIFVRTSTFLNERYLFMPSIAFCLLVAWFAMEKLPALMRKTQEQPNFVGLSLIALLALLFGLRTWTRVPDWGGEGRGLVESAIQVSSGSYRANYYYGNMLYNDRYKALEKATDAASVTERNALLDKIEPYLDKSLAINPGYRLAAPLKVQLAVARFNQGKDLDKLLKDFEKLIQGQPQNGEMLVMVLDVLKSLKGSDPNIYNFFCHRVGYNFYFLKMHDAEGAVEFLNLALSNYASDKNTMQDLIEVYGSMGNSAKVREMQQLMSM